MARPKVQSILIDTGWCKRCGICVATCPKKVFDADAEDKVIVARLEDCISCEICERICPDLAIQLVWAEPDNAGPSGTAGASGPEPTSSGTTPPTKDNP